MTTLSPLLSVRMPTAHISTPAEWMQWLDRLLQSNITLQLAVLLGCGVLAWALAVLLQRSLAHWFLTEEERSADHNGSRWSQQRIMLFGRRGIDGLLFPIFWLLLVYMGMALLRIPQHASLFRVAIPLLFALLIIRIAARLLRAAFADKHWVHVLENTTSWLVWVGAALWLTGVLDVVLEQLAALEFRLGSSSISVLTLLQGLVLLGVSVLLALWLSSLLEARLLRAVSGSALSLRKIISNLVRAIMLFVAVLTALSITGIDLTALSVFGGALGVGIGLGLQRLAANYVSGFVILAERSIRIGDMIRVDDFEGRVTNITARYTVLRSLGGVEAILPNETLINQRVENNSLRDRLVLLSTTVSVDYSSDVQQVRDLLINAALSQERVMRTPAPSANLENFGADGLDFRLNFWIADPENGTGGLRSAINIAILEALRAHHIDIPYPQRVVRHIVEGQATAPHPHLDNA